jgi:hypothetical protein
MTQDAVLPGNADLYLRVRVLIGIILGLSVTHGLCVRRSGL